MGKKRILNYVMAIEVFDDDSVKYALEVLESDMPEKDIQDLILDSLDCIIEEEEGVDMDDDANWEGTVEGSNTLQ